MEIKKIQKLSHEMKELLEDERLKEIRSKDDKDARFGHKRQPVRSMDIRIILR